MENKKFVEAARIIGWREMEPGYWYYIGMENRGNEQVEQTNHCRVGEISERRANGQFLCAAFTLLRA